MSDYQLPPNIEKLSTPLSNLALCEARLVADGRYTWVVLIPRRGGVIEIEDLSAADRAVLMDEIVYASAGVRRMGEAIGRPVEKLNVCQIGNVTKELHIHVIGRQVDDEAWPKPVWNAGPATPWEDDLAKKATAAWGG